MLQTKGIKLNLLFQCLYLNSNFALTVGFLNPALNNLAQRVTGSTPVRGTQNVFFRDACVAESKKSL